MNTPVTISESNLVGLAFFGADGDVGVNGSVIGTLQFFGCNAELDFSEATVGEVWNLHDSILGVTGTVTFDKQGTSGGDSPWINSTLTRTYDVELVAVQPEDAAGQQVELRDSGGQIVGTAITDQDGHAQFTVEFDDSNYLGHGSCECRLQAQPTTCCC